MTHIYNKRNLSACGRSTSGAKPSVESVSQKDYESPSVLVYRKMENLIRAMQDEHSGVPVRTVKSFMSKIPSVFTGADLVSWMMKCLDTDDTNDALHLAHLIATHGYIFPIDDHILAVKNDNTYYRFQTPCFWPTVCVEPDNIDYAVYLCKRTMQNKQRLELADYEAENLARLQKTFARKWEFVFMQAEAQAKVDKKRDKLDRKILDSQERAYWDVHRPAPGCVNTTEADIKKTCRTSRKVKTSIYKPHYNVFSGSICPNITDYGLHDDHLDGLKSKIECLHRLLDRRRIKISKVAESYLSYFAQYAEFDAFVMLPDPSNPWISDNTEFWEQETTPELLKDSSGREHFMQFLERNSVQKTSTTKLRRSNEKALREACLILGGLSVAEAGSTEAGGRDRSHIYSEHLAPGAVEPVNVDSRVAEIVQNRMEGQIDRYCLDEAEDHIFKLMKNDSYNRYLRSDTYKELLGRLKKKSKKRFTSEVRRLRELAGTKGQQLSINPTETRSD